MQGDEEDVAISFFYLGARPAVLPKTAPRPSYRFKPDRLPVSNEALRDALRRGYRLASEWAGQPPDKPTHIRDVGGNLLTYDAFFGDSGSRTRVRSKGPGTPKVDAPPVKPVVLPVRKEVPVATSGQWTPRPGWAWVLSEPAIDSKGDLFELGSEIFPRSEDAVQMGSKGLMQLDEQTVVTIELVAEANLHSYRDLRRKCFENNETLEPLKRPAEVGRVKSDREVLVEEEIAEDLRCLPVLYNTMGHREREWKDAVKLFQSDAFADWPLSGPRSLEWVANFFCKAGLPPVIWLERHLQTEGWSDTDRSVHELRVLAEVFELAAQYDQLNLCALACFERLGRRWQAILEAHSRDPLNPDYEADGKFWAPWTGDFVLPLSSVPLWLVS